MPRYEYDLSGNRITSVSVKEAVETDELFEFTAEAPDPVAADQSTKPRIAVIEFKNKADNQWSEPGDELVLTSVLLNTGDSELVTQTTLAQSGYELDF
jgi:hypothetical protein